MFWKINKISFLLGTGFRYKTENLNLSQPPRSKIKQTKNFVKWENLSKSRNNSFLHDYRPDLLAFLHECSLTWLRPFQDGGRGKAGLAKHKLFRRCQIPCCRRQPSRPGMPRKRISGKVVFVTLMIIFKNFDMILGLFLFVGFRIIVSFTSG